MNVRQMRARRPCRLIFLFYYEEIASLEAGSWGSTATCPEESALVGRRKRSTFSHFWFLAGEIRMVRKRR